MFLLKKQKSLNEALSRYYHVDYQHPNESVV